MKRWAVVVLGLALGLSAAEAAACCGHCCGGKNGVRAGSYQGHGYDVATVETLRGAVVGVERIDRGPQMSGVHALIKTDTETIPVHLGPQWFVEQHEPLAAGDVVEVTGSRVTVDGKPALIAAEVRKGDVSLKLRDPDGFPVWSGWRRRNR
jgi:hypothetical protein